MAKNPNKRVKVYILIDDQSNKSLADTRIFDMLGVSGEWSNYTMKTCNGERETKGRNLSGLIVESLDGATKIEAPSLLECAEIPGNMSEIAIPEVAMAFPHLKSIAGQITPLNKGSNVLLLLGRDVPQVHKVRETCNGPNKAPWAQRLDLGWVVVGEVCLNGVHRPKTISTLRTQVLITGRPTTLQPCPNTFQIHTLFDDKVDFRSLSVEERKFLEIMEKEGGLRDDKWTAPLPFKKPRERLPNNREQAWSRAQILRKSMDRNPLKKQHMLDFMDGVINKGHAEVAPPLKNDEELPGCYLQEWKSWKNDLKELQNVSVPRAYPLTFGEMVGLHVFCDASDVAVAAVAYLFSKEGEQRHTGFVFGKSRLAPKAGHTIPRLELCAAVLAIEIAKVICAEVDIPSQEVTYHSDSKVVLGYQNNTTRRFHTYVANRVFKILQFSDPHQWKYVHTSKNPADHGTCQVAARNMKDCPWLKGPHCSVFNVDVPEWFRLVSPQQDKELRQEDKVIVMKTNVHEFCLLERANKFSSWESLIRPITLLIHVACSFHYKNNDDHCKGWHHCRLNDIALKQRAETVSYQEKFYQRELRSLKSSKPLPNDSSILSLAPMLNEDGLICVGGRLRKATLPIIMKHPIVVPGKCHIATLLVRHFHHNIYHQGRQFTEGAVREAGYWVVYRIVYHPSLRNLQKVKRKAQYPAYG
ncbi:uncharacterized protein LOC117113514 [Anneissia japonica]|uniref:uncharacterized protein LOC117113514 n=1 Tax=Anneissia japonica TaxID=1529436 RepID=UPI0014258567|nr:uncharacterized protein LOC117113514 [Anneissia japonica]